MKHGVRFLSAIFAATLAGVSPAAPVLDAWPAGAGGGPVGAAALGGVYASADTALDEIEVRGIRGETVRTITRAEVAALAPWMTLDTGPDGPAGIAVSDSGRLVFITVIDDAAATDGLGSDIILRCDTTTGDLTVFARAELGGDGGQFVALGAVHFAGRLHIGGSDGRVRTYRAERNDAAGQVLSTALLSGPVVGLAVERSEPTLLAAAGGQLLAADARSSTPFFVPIAAVTAVRGLAWSEHYGTGGSGAGGGGLFLLTQPGADAQVLRVLPAMIAGTQPVVPQLYATVPGTADGLASTACGRLLVGRSGGPSVLSDSGDQRLSFEDWLVDEFSQVVAFARGLVSPDGEPPGWVIDAEATAGGARFHPASPDAAAWAVLLLAMEDELFGNPVASEEIATILERYAALAPDGRRPGLSADGMFRHWCDPFSTAGASKPGWDPEFATLSTMKIVWAAARAREGYPTAPRIRVAADRILTRVQNWNGYIEPGTDAVYLKSSGSQPDFTTPSRPFNEAILFAEQAAANGTGYARNAYARWLDRPRHPTATFLTGQPITGDAPGVFQSAFLTLYALLGVDEFALSPAWQDQVRASSASHSAWTDDRGPRLRTVFSAGTTKPEWGGYHADTLGDHPGDVTSLPSLMAYAAGGTSGEAVGAYHAYRMGARQAFASGATVLNRRSAIDPAWSPPDAGLPDVALGALGLAELIEPGSVSGLLQGVYPRPCIADMTGDGLVTFADVASFVGAFNTQARLADLGGDGLLNFADVSAFVAAFGAGCP